VVVFKGVTRGDLRNNRLLYLL